MSNLNYLKTNVKKITALSLMIFCCAFLTNCGGTKFVKFPEKENEVYPSPNLKSFLKDNKNPKVVLRIPSNKGEVTTSENKEYLYDAIEKELLKNGFIVRDRQLFNQVLSRTDNSADYSKLKERTDTDLIIELSKLNDVLYETNKYKTSKGKEGLLSYIYKRYGAEVEFKIILMKDNEFAGTYTFNYSPCGKYPCEINSDFKKNWWQAQKGKKEFEKKKRSFIGIYTNCDTTVSKQYEKIKSIYITIFTKYLFYLSL